MAFITRLSFISLGHWPHFPSYVLYCVIFSGLLCDREGLSWNLLEALRLLSNSEGEDSCEDLTIKLLNKSIQCRERMLERMLQRKLTYNVSMREYYRENLPMM